MQVRVEVKAVKTYHRIAFVFDDMESASIFMNTAMNTAEQEIEFEVEPIYEKSVTEETTEKGDEE